MFLVNCFERFTMLRRCFLLSKMPQSFIIRLFFFSTFVRMFVHRFLVLKVGEGLKRASAPLLARMYMW
jgi:hypothetical protein